MNFKLFLESLLLEFPNPTKGLVDSVVKVKLMPDDFDRELYMRFTASYPNGDPESKEAKNDARNARAIEWLTKNGLPTSYVARKTLAAQVIRARYAVAADTEPGRNDKLQKDAVAHNAYFAQPKGDNAILIYKGREIEVPRMGFSDLKRKLENYPIEGGKTGNIKKDMPRFTHPTVAGKYDEMDEKGNLLKKKQTHGINIATLGIKGHSSQEGWSLAYHKTGVATGKLDKEEQKYAKEKSAIDTSTKDVDEKGRIKELTAKGNYFIDKVLTSSEETPTDIQDVDGEPMTNKQIKDIAMKSITLKVRKEPNLDKDDIWHAFLMLMRNKYADHGKYKSGEIMIHDLVNNAIHDVKEDMGIGRKGGDVKHGAKYGMQTSSISAGDEDSEQSMPAKQPTQNDLERRLVLKPEYKDSDKEHDDTPNPERKIHNIKTYKTSQDDENGNEDLRRSLDKMKQQVHLPSTAIVRQKSEEDEAASAQELAARKKDLENKIRSMRKDEPIKKSSGISDRLRSRFFGNG